MLTIRISRRTALFLVLGVFLAIPLGAWASHSFTDVPDSHTFHADIEWLKESGVTKGCNPPDNTQFCPDDPVSRGAMAAFMRRLAENKVVDAATAVTADHATTADHANTAGDADVLDGLSSEALMTKNDYDSDQNSVVDSAEVKIRYATEASPVNFIYEPDYVRKCLTSPLTFATETTLVASGGLTLEPLGTDFTPISADFYYWDDDASSSTVVSGIGLADVPEDGTGPATVPVNVVLTLPAGTYYFGILPVGAFISGDDDYFARCELTVTAYTGLGATTDVAP